MRRVENPPVGVWHDADRTAPPADEPLVVRWSTGREWKTALGIHAGVFDPWAFPVDGQHRRVSHWLRLPPVPLAPEPPLRGERYHLHQQVDEGWEVLDAGGHLDPVGRRHMVEVRNLQTSEVSVLRVTAWSDRRLATFGGVPQVGERYRVEGGLCTVTMVGDLLDPLGERIMVAVDFESDDAAGQSRQTLYSLESWFAAAPRKVADPAPADRRGDAPFRP